MQYIILHSPDIALFETGETVGSAEKGMAWRPSKKNLEFVPSPKTTMYTRCGPEQEDT